jgi:hypothetical protein
MDRYFKNFGIGDLIEHFNGNMFTFYGRQRAVDLERVLEIETYFMKIYETEKKIPIRGCLVFAFCEGKYHLIDGQHRYMAMVGVFKKTGINFDIMCEILTVSNAGQIFAEFVNINKAVPVPVYYLNPTETVEKIVDWIKENYPMALSEKKIIPRMAIESFKDNMTILVNKCANNEPEQMIRTLVIMEDYIKQNIENNLDFFLLAAAGYNTKHVSTIKNVLKDNRKKMHKKLYIGLYYTKAWMELFAIHNEKLI